MNTGALWPGLVEAGRRVRVMQTKLHRWATAEPGRCFDDLYNLVYDPAFLTVAWRRVRGNKGARTAGIDGVTPRSLPPRAETLLVGLRDDLKARRFVPQRVRQKTIPKGSGKVRSLGIPTVGDRVVQASLKLVLEPIFEADFKPCSYGFRPSGGLRTLLLRFISLVHRPVTTSGCSRETSRRASMRSTTRSSWIG